MSANTGRSARQNSKFCDFMSALSMLSMSALSSTTVPSALYLVLRQPVGKRLVAGQPHEVSGLGLVSLRFVDCPLQVVAGNFLHQFLQIEATAQRLCQQVGPGGRGGGKH